MLDQLLGLDALPSPAALRFLAALSNPIAIQQYLANEPNTFMIGEATVAVTGRFTRQSGAVDNVILYHWTDRNTVNWVLGQGEPQSLPTGTLPDPNVWRYGQEMNKKMQDLLRR